MREGGREGAREISREEGGRERGMFSFSDCRTLGQISCLLLFTFAGGHRIARSLRANVCSPNMDALGPSSEYRGGRDSGGRGSGRRSIPSNVVPGEKPSR